MDTNDLVQPHERPELRSIGEEEPAYDGPGPPLTKAQKEPITEDRSPETAITPPRRRWKHPGVAVAAIIVAAALIYWRWQDALWIFNEVLLPYTGAIAFVSLGLIGLLFKDWNKYEHPYAARSALCILMLCGILMAVNSHRDRRTRQKDRIENAKALDGVRSEAKEESENTIRNIENLHSALTARADDTDKNLGQLASEVHSFKEKVNPDKVRDEMDGLRSTLAKIIDPPKAELLFTFTPFVDPPLDGKTLVPIRDITLPLNQDGSVHVTFTLANNTPVQAKGTQLSIEICRECKFAKEPAGFRKLGRVETMGNYSYGDLPAGGVYPELSVDIIPPPNMLFFDIQVSSRCDTCVFERVGPIAKVHFQRN